MTINDPFIFTIFGASGDLSRLKLFPSIYELLEKKKLPKEYYIVGYARSEKTTEEFRNEFIQKIKEKREVDQNLLNEILEHVYYFSGQYDNLKDFEKYQKFLTDLTGQLPKHVAYFSVPPVVFKPIIENLGKAFKGSDINLVIEKPFGDNVKTATELFHFTNMFFNEEQIYLLDHYLGKTSVQSILDLRYSNKVFDVLLNPENIANIQISALEQIGVANRIGYFDQVGIIKDFIQSHLIQILALVTMSLPASKNAECVSREKQSILKALNFKEDKSNISIGQYKSYLEEEGVPKDSKTETFAAVKIQIDHEGWKNVPIYLRTGKKLEKKHTYVVIEYKKHSHQSPEEVSNKMIIDLQPNEKFEITLVKSGYTPDMSIAMSESIACVGDACLPEHGLLLMDIFRGEQVNFLTFPEILAGWKLTDKILNFAKNIEVEKYEEGTKGPKSQEEITKQDNFNWN